MSESFVENSAEITSQFDEEHILKIVIATDIHLGYYEKDPIRCNDSFNTFEEILKSASNNNVDLLLLGGDLFHESKPSTVCYHRCISLLKKYCLGNKPIQIQFLSDPSKNFSHLKNPIVNYEDPNLNIQIPVFSIHGNHDDPTGENNLSAMDILADTGLVNYFGKWTNLNKIEIYPVLIKKGETQIAIYGLSHIKDERLSRLFKDKKVTMIRPLDSDKWFNILVLHQNRAQNRGLKNYIPESVLPEFIDMVLWGHEHDCRIDPEDTINGPLIIQPGSSVATSLALGESLEKFIALIRIHRKKFCLDKIKLHTVRPFIFRDLEISKPGHYDEASASDYAKNRIQVVVEEMLEDALKKKTEKSPMPPLLRLVVHFTDDSLMSNAIRLGQNYRDKVANPVDMFSFKLKKPVTKNKRRDDDPPEDLEDLHGDQLTESIFDFIGTYLNAKQTDLTVLSTKGLCEAVSRYIDRNDTDAIDDIVKHQSTKSLEKLLEMENVSEDNYLEILEQFREERNRKPNEELQEIENVLQDESRLARLTPVAAANDAVNDSSDDDLEIDGNNGNNSSLSNMSARGTASGRPARGRGSRGPRRARARGRAK